MTNEKRPYDLSRSEYIAILDLVSGNTAKDCAFHHNRSTSTIRTQRQAAYKKMNVHGASYAILKWIREQEVPVLTRRAYEAGYRAGLKDRINE